ncbi:mitochondrial inner membrane protease ATP23 isoform X2 [Populus trichocarpa]|uniref:mitochondrial inner membrane protease ATP23 isoform X2 n=1 Tax=Populus trichocarpa TaxID=3694 RepID=UPI002278BA21|nr:mitochondrial inner membrane protease ATP23 isoform X2 [Populus trichocarpa]
MTEEPGTTPGSDGTTVEECKNMIRRSFRTPMVKFLREHMEKAGCGVGENFLKAVNCDKKIAGGYVRGEGIMVCSNHMNTQDDVNQVVIHELIHAYDDCRAANLDWADCAHHACSEIRAGHLSGDCHYKRELLRGYMKLRGHEQHNLKSAVYYWGCGYQAVPTQKNLCMH